MALNEPNRAQKSLNNTKMSKKSEWTQKKSKWTQMSLRSLNEPKCAQVCLNKFIGAWTSLN